MTNLLKNPTLDGFQLHRHFTDNEGKTGTIEFPPEWEFIATPMHPEDPNLLPQSLHRPRGFVIAAGFRKWEAGYVQRDIQLEGGKRYLAKAVFQPDVNFPPDSPVDLTAITWRFWIEGNSSHVGQDWQMTGKGQFKQEEENLFVFETLNDVKVDYYFKARSVWPGNACDFNVYELSLEEVPADYGGPTVPMLRETSEANIEDAASIGPASIGVRDETPAHGTPPIPDLSLTVTGPSGRALDEVLTEADIDVIVAGLRSMERITDNPVIIEGFHRLADALEKLK